MTNGTNKDKIAIVTEEYGVFVNPFADEIEHKLNRIQKKLSGTEHYELYNRLIAILKTLGWKFTLPYGTVLNLISNMPAVKKAEAGSLNEIADLLEAVKSDCKEAFRKIIKAKVPEELDDAIQTLTKLCMRDEVISFDEKARALCSKKVEYAKASTTPNIK